jgi:hypothetical protein
VARLKIPMGDEGEQTTIALRGEERHARPTKPASSQDRIVDRLDPRLVNVLTALGFGVPIVGYFWFLARYSVDAIRYDQWDDVAVIKASYVDFFPLHAMWAQHNENRIFFQNAIVILLAHFAHFNVQIEEWLGALMLVAATMCILWAHKRRSQPTPWLYYCPVVILALSVAQEENTLWGFQIGWYLVLLCLAVAILLLDRVTLTWVAFLGALAAAVVGSFSSLQGLLIWPTGLVLLYFRRRSSSYVGPWITAAVASSILYFYNFNFNDFYNLTPDHHFALHHPLVALKFYLLAIGDIVGKPIQNGTGSAEETMVMLFGILIVALAIATVAICGLRRDERSGSPLGLALISYGLMFAAIVTQGRVQLGYAGAGFSRYTTFDLLIPIGIYLALVDRRLAVERTAMRSSGRRQPSNPEWRKVALPWALGLVLIVIVVQIPLGTYNGIQRGRSDYTADIQAANVLRNINGSSDSEVSSDLDAFASASWLREQARTLEEHRLSVFAGG